MGGNTIHPPKGKIRESLITLELGAVIAGVLAPLGQITEEFPNILKRIVAFGPPTGNAWIFMFLDFTDFTLRDII